LFVLGFVGFALGGAAELTSGLWMSGHDFGPSEIEMARGGRVGSLLASPMESSMGGVENEL
jgi:hypothetical protein